MKKKFLLLLLLPKLSACHKSAGDNDSGSTQADIYVAGLSGFVSGMVGYLDLPVPEIKYRWKNCRVNLYQRLLLTMLSFQIRFSESRMNK